MGGKLEAFFRRGGVALAGTVALAILACGQEGAFALVCGSGKSASGISVPSQSELHAAKSGAISRAFEDVAATDSLDGAGECVGQIRSMFHVELSAPSFTWSQVIDSLAASGKKGLASAAEQACLATAANVRSNVSASLSRIRAEVVSLAGGTVASPVDVLCGQEGLKVRVNDSSPAVASALRARLSSSISSLAR